MLYHLAAACMIGAMGFAGPAAQSNKTIVRLIGQNGTITISSTIVGVRYSANDARGGAICSNLTLDQLRAKHPDLCRQVDAAICAQADASLGELSAFAGPD